MRGVTLVGFVLFTLAVGLTGACDKPAAPPPPAPAPAPPPPPPPPAASADGGTKPKMVANPDGLSLADRIAKRQAEEKKLAAQLAGDEKKRLLTYDKTKLPLHQRVWASIKKIRASYDKAKSMEDAEKIRAAQMKSIEATGKLMATIDPNRGNSNVTTDYDVMLNALASDYPNALGASFNGDKKALDEQNAELDKRTKKIDEWLAEAKTFKK